MSEITEPIEMSELDLIELCECMRLFDHLCNKGKFIKYINEFFPKVKEKDIVQSYLWFVCCIIDEICVIITSFEPFFNKDFDETLNKGINTSTHFSEFCTTSVQGKLIYHFFNFFKNNLTKIEDLNQLFSILSEFYEVNKDFIRFFLDLNVKKTTIFSYFLIDNLLNPKLDIHLKKRNLLLIQAHFFEDHNDFLNFSKDAEGNWISSQGFFIGLTFSLFFISEKNFRENTNEIIPKIFPFKDFSLEYGGLFFLKTYSIKNKQPGFKPANEKWIYVGSNGVLQLFSFINENLSEYYDVISKIFGPKENDNEVQVYLSENEKKITICNGNLVKFLEFLAHLPSFNETYSLFKIFDYQPILPLNIGNLHTMNSIFRVLTNGAISCNKSYKTSMKLNILQVFEGKNESEYLGKNEIRQIDIDHILHVFNNKKDLEIIAMEKKRGMETNPKGFIKEINEAKENQIICGYFIRIPAHGTLGTNSTLWIGEFFFGSNWIGDEISLNQNFMDLVENLQKIKNEIILNTYVIKKDLFKYWVKLTEDCKIIHHSVLNPFLIFFNSTLK